MVSRADAPFNSSTQLTVPQAQEAWSCGRWLLHSCSMRTTARCRWAKMLMDRRLALSLISWGAVPPSITRSGEAGCSQSSCQGAKSGWARSQPAQIPPTPAELMLVHCCCRRAWRRRPAARCHSGSQRGSADATGRCTPERGPLILCDWLERQTVPATVNNSYGGLVTKVEMGVFQTESAVMQSVPDIPFGPEWFYRATSEERRRRGRSISRNLCVHIRSQ